MEDQRNAEKSLISVVEVCIHQSRDIHNVCIYQNQDVYAKFSLTDKPEEKISSQVILGGGRNPVFNETFRFDVLTMESSIKCEVWMLSRIRNYLEDQLLGFALVPVLEIVSESGKPARAFELSMSELFHSPAGFVDLSFKYIGTLPETVMELAVSNVLVSSVDKDVVVHESIPCELDRIEFPDQEILKENDRMVSEYLQFPSNHLMPSLQNGDNLIVKSDGHSVEKLDSNQTDTTTVLMSSTSQPLTEVTVKPKQKVVQEDIVDMYMKSMQQSTDALAKMKLLMDIADGLSAEKDNKIAEDSVSDGKAPGLKNADPGQRVYYGSRAFF